MYILNEYVDRNVSLDVDVEQPKLDERLRMVNIPKGLVESLDKVGFTIENILNSHPSDIAQILGIDNYVAQIIYQETKYYYKMNNNKFLK